MFRTKVVEKIKTHILCSVTFFFRKNMLFMMQCGNMLYRAEQATDYKMALAHCLLDIEGYKCTLGICNTYCFSTAAVVAQTGVNVSLRVLCTSG